MCMRCWAGAGYHANNAGLCLSTPGGDAVRHRRVLGIIATVIFAMPPAVWLTTNGILQVDNEQLGPRKRLARAGGCCSRCSCLRSCRR